MALFGSRSWPFLLIDSSIINIIGILLRWLSLKEPTIPRRRDLNTALIQNDEDKNKNGPIKGQPTRHIMVAWRSSTQLCRLTDWRRQKKTCRNDDALRMQNFRSLSTWSKTNWLPGDHSASLDNISSSAWPQRSTHDGHRRFSSMKRKFDPN